VARIQELKQIESLASSDFPKQNTIGPVSQRGFEKVTNGDRGYAVLLAAGFEANEIRLRKLYLGGVFDQKDAFIRGNELSERVQKSGLASSRAATNEQIAPLQDVVFKAIRECVGDGSAFDEVRDFEVTDVEFANGERHTTQTAGRNDGCNATAVR